MELFGPWSKVFILMGFLIIIYTVYIILGRILKIVEITELIQAVKRKANKSYMQYGNKL